VNDGTGLSRGDRNRNERLGRLRELLPIPNAIVGIDLADMQQAAVVCDHDSRVLARRRVSCRAWELGELLDWAVERAEAAGFWSPAPSASTSTPTTSAAGAWTKRSLSRPLRRVGQGFVV
jgi:hypothetical protein